MGIQLFGVDNILDLGQGFALRLPQGQAAIDVERAAVGHGISAGSLALDLGNGDRALSQQRIRRQARGQ
jgi:hypothetical protein